MAKKNKGSSYSDLFSLLSGDDRESSKIKRFSKSVLDGMGNKDLRRLEEENLIPEEYSEYIDSGGVTDPLKELTCKMSFRNKKEFGLFKKYFRVSSYGGYNVSDLRLLMAFLKAMDAGSVTWFDDTEKLIWGYHESGGKKTRSVIKRRERKIIKRKSR